MRPASFRSRSFLLLSALSLAAPLASACSVSSNQEPEPVEQQHDSLAGGERMPRYAVIRDAARGRGIPEKAFLLAGIAYDETGLAQCWSEATWACQGPSSPDCGGGPVIAGSGDGPCSAEQGGLGMFQFDSGTFADTLARYGPEVLTVQGQASHAVDYVINMVLHSDYTPIFTNADEARAWINAFNVDDPAQRDQWISTVVRYYNGCQPGWACWAARYATYSDGLSQVLADTEGTPYWGL
jgi:hypothetical protein